MGCSIISFVLTFNTLLVLAAASSSSWRSFTPSVTEIEMCNCINNYIWWNKSVTKLDQFFSAAHDKAKFTEVLNSTAQNYRLLEDSVHKPIIIFRAAADIQVPFTVLCAQRFNINIRVRSGGHDYEGLSFASFIENQQFMILDLFNLRNIDIDAVTGTAWVQAGATNGELYYRISRVNRTLAFPAGLCTTLGFGGHVSGGGYGSMMRKFGLAADNVLDVLMVDAFGIVRSREIGNMGEELFWALRGGGGGNFGVILAWQIKLVTVPWNVTMFTSVIHEDADGARVLQKWQKVVPFLDPNLFIRVIMQTGADGKVISNYQALYLGSKTELVILMRKKLPELRVTSVDNCTEMSWIESVMNFAGFSSKTKLNYLLTAKPAFPLLYMKAKSDFLRQPMSIKGIEGLWNIFREKVQTLSTIIWNPYGGMMSQIPEYVTPFPHRNGVICKIQYVATWNSPNATKQLDMEDWMRVMYKHMTAFVSDSPREAYVNYRDLDIGKKDGRGSNCSYPEIWGPKYFKDNYQRLVDVKTTFDPFNFFNNEQSIPTTRKMKQCTNVV